MNINSLILRFEGRCYYCKRHVERTFANVDLLATKDHFVPKCRSIQKMALAQTNEVLACHGCNNAKGDMTGQEFISFLATRKLSPSYIEYLEKRLADRLKLGNNFGGARWEVSSAAVRLSLP